MLTEIRGQELFLLTKWGKQLIRQRAGPFRDHILKHTYLSDVRNTKLNKIEELIGEEIAGVHFVRDYVEFYFDGPIVRALSNPKILMDNICHVFPDQGSRDLLCSLINKKISNIEIAEHVSAKFCISNGAVLVIPLCDEGEKLVEYMHFMPDVSQPMQEW